MTEDEEILVCAVRYAMGRRTYVVAEAAGWVRRRWSGLSIEAKQQILGDIGEALEREKGNPGTIGMDMDRERWQSLYEELSTGI